MGLRTLTDYRDLLDSDPVEWRRLDGLCRITISRFRRDRGVWDCLQRELLPRMMAQALTRGEPRLRIWSAGCASGEEPYTLALMCALDCAQPHRDPEIIATDADPQLLSRARRGCYTAGSLREVPAHWRAHFDRVGTEWCLHTSFRHSVRFLEQDIRRDLPSGSFDLILCRNLVFTYFQDQLQKAIAQRLVGALVPGGLLLLGGHETLPELSSGLLQERSWLYRRGAI